ncbi:uncharacterized protein LOC142336328 isoform X2 [Convolutriloba macropyga]|uniref:uncharacterized protein LOC142336328 isoform X2 n=1 Tax=Convolutriloba macropyga TaxID=536237 RepID=UPI003F524923
MRRLWFYVRRYSILIPFKLTTKLRRWRQRIPQSYRIALLCVLTILVVLTPKSHKFLLNVKDTLMLRAPSRIVDLELPTSVAKQAKYRSAIIRIFGNSLYPLQQRDQGSDNLQFIMERENIRESTSKYLWVINRIVNKTESSRITGILANEHSLHVDFDVRKLKALYEADHKLAVQYATDINNARNEALLYAADSLDVDWLVLLDGNTFLTDEAYDLLHSGLAEAERNHQFLYFIPMHRLSSDQQTLNRHTVLGDLETSLTGLQEPYLAIHKTAFRQFQQNNVKVFDTGIDYGRRSKISSLEIFSNFYSTRVGCMQAYSDSSVRKITTGGEKLNVASKCSYAIRLLYWPSGFSNLARNDYSMFTNLIIYKGYFFDGVSVPEENNLVRSQVRQDSIRELERSIADIVDDRRN